MQRAMGGFQEERDTPCCYGYSKGRGLAPPSPPPEWADRLHRCVIPQGGEGSC